MKDSWDRLCFPIVIATITTIVVWSLLWIGGVLLGRAFSGPAPTPEPPPQQPPVCNKNHGINIFDVAQTKMKEACAESRFDFANFERPFLVAKRKCDFSVIYLTRENVFPLRIVELVFLDGKISQTKFYAIKDSDGFNGTNREQFFVSRDKKGSYVRLSLRGELKVGGKEPVLETKLRCP